MNQAHIDQLDKVTETADFLKSMLAAPPEIGLLTGTGLGDITNTCDYFVLITGDTDVHLRAIADNIEDKLTEAGITLWRKEGYGNANWILLDYIDVVVHVFSPEKRDYYNLDNLWADAKVKLVRDGVQK